MSLVKRNGIFYCDIYDEKGRRKRISTRTRGKKLAERIHAQHITDVEEGRFLDKQKAKRLTFQDMVERYLQKYVKERDSYTVKKLLPAFGELTISEITTERISDYREQRLKSVQPATIYQELSLMRRMFNVARREWKWVRDNPVADLSFSIGNKNARDRWLTVEEEKKLLECATNPLWLRSLLIFALHTGMRRGEILNLLWKDVDFSRRLLVVTKSKNGDKRSIPMSQTLYDTLKSMNKVVDISSRVFPISVRSLREAFDSALTKAGIADFHFHDLRHTFATRIVQKGGDLYRVKELLGHKTINMTARYAHHCPESLRSCVMALDSCHSLVTVACKTV